MSKKYVLAADRFRQHAYVCPIGVFDSEDLALKAAKFHSEYRGGKYDHKILELEENKEYDVEEPPSYWVQDLSNWKHD